MTLRAQFLLFGPIAAMLALHVAGLVMSERGWVAPVGQHDLWSGWNVAGPILLLIAGGTAVRRDNEEQPPEPSHLARITWGAALADLAVTALLAVTLLHRP